MWPRSDWVVRCSTSRSCHRAGPPRRRVPQRDRGAGRVTRGRRAGDRGRSRRMLARGACGVVGAVVGGLPRWPAVNDRSCAACVLRDRPGDDLPFSGVDESARPSGGVCPRGLCSILRGASAWSRGSVGSRIDGGSVSMGARRGRRDGRVDHRCAGRDDRATPMARCRHHACVSRRSSDAATTKLATPFLTATLVVIATVTLG